MINRLKVFETIYIFCYIFFFVALYIEDIAFNNPITHIIKFMKIFTIIMLCIMLFIRFWKLNEIFKIAIMMLLGAAILLFSGDFFWLIILLMGVLSSDVEEKVIFKSSICVMLTLTVLVVILYIFGFLPDVVTYRSDFSQSGRYSIGFAHSAVLPLIVLYTLCYYVRLRKERSNEVLLFICGVTAIFLYFICESRNAVFFTVCICCSTLLFKDERIRKKTNNLIKFMAKYIFILCALFSILPGYLRNQGILMEWWYEYDSIFTNRSMLASSAIEAYGIKFINNMSYEEYTSQVVEVDSYLQNGIVLDSAYIFVFVRYGVLVLLLLWIIFCGIFSSSKSNVIDCMIVVILALANSIDNDILSYGFLPFMILGVRQMCSEKNSKCVNISS